MALGILILYQKTHYDERTMYLNLTNMSLTYVFDISQLGVLGTI